MFVDLTTNEFVCRIVYFGPGLAGKSTNLTYLRDNAPSLRTTELKQADNEGERTLSFALYPVDVRPVAGLSCRVDVITNPGRSYYNSNRRALLQGADGIVFVADSRREAIDENIDSMNDLWSFLNHNRLGADIPLVVQYNKQDEDSALPVEQLDPLLNSQQKPSFGVAAVQGTNVIACFQAILAAVVATVATEENIRSEMTEAQQRGGSSESRLESILDPEEEDQSWLLTCYNCDAVLEVQSARRGDLFTCGSCSAILEVIEPSTGSTRAGQMPSSNHLVHHYEPESKRPTHTRADEDSALQPRDQDPRTRPLPSNDFHFQDPHSQSVIRHLGGALGSGAPGSSLSAPSELMPHMPGFEFQEEIDSSLLGTRYRTMEIDRQRSLRALVLSPMLLRQPGYRDQLEPHVRLAAKVRHPNLLPVLGVRWWNEIPVVFSEDVPGYEPLAAILARRRTLAPPQAMGIIRQLSLALEEAGRHGVVHGWLRPEVVLLNPSGNILLDDLAIPKNPGFLVRESMGGSASTEYHLAPEQLQGEITPDIRTDIFLLGALLFRMVTGEGLVTGYNAHEALHKLSTNGPRRMREVDPNVSREMDSFFLRMVAVDRQDRMQRHNELLQGLDKFGGGAKRNTLRAVRHPNTARVTRRGSAPGSGVRNTTAGRRSYSTLSGDDSRSRRSAGKKGSNPVLLVVLLLVLVGLVVAFVFRDRFGDPYRIREKDPATTTAERDDDRTGGRSGQEPDSTADELPTEPVALARALLTRYEATPDDDELEAELLDAIRALRVDQTTRRTGTVLYDRYRAIAEEHNLTKQQQRQDATPPPDGSTPAADDANTGDTSEQDQPIAVSPAREEPAQPAENTEEPAIDGAVTAGGSSAAVKMEISRLMSQERYGDALELAQTRLADAEQRAYFENTITQRHDATRTTIARMVRNANDLNEIALMLQPAYGTWGFPDDRTWADSLKTAAEQRLGGTVPSDPQAVRTTPVEPETPETDPTDRHPPSMVDGLDQGPTQAAPDPGAIDTIDGIPLAVIQADMALDAALEEMDIARARSVLMRLGDDVPHLDALQTKIRLFEEAPAMMATAFTERPVKSRVKTPFGQEQWDVAGVTGNGLAVRSPKGEETILTWSQLQLEDVGRLYDRIASEADVAARSAVACVTLLVADRAGFGSIAASRAAKLDYPQQQHLETLIDLHRKHAVASLVLQAEQALAAGDTQALAEASVRLQQDSKRDFAERKAALARYGGAASPGGAQPARQGGGDGVMTPPPVGPTADRDRLDFSTPSDLLAFPIRDGQWEVRDRALHAGTRTNTLLRSDMHSARACTVVLAIGQATGQLDITFRGTAFTFDFVKQGFLARNDGDRTAFTAFPVITNRPYTVNLALDGAMMTMNVNGKESIQLGAGTVTDQLRITSVNCHDLALKQVLIQREATAGGGAARQQESLLEQTTGWTPIGNIELDAPAIRFHPARVGRSAIFRSIDPQIAGMAMQARGTGALVVLIGDRDAGELFETSIDLPPGDALLDVQIRWSADTMQVVARGEEDVGAAPPTVLQTGSIPHRHLILQATEQMTLLSPPTPIAPDR